VQVEVISRRDDMLIRRLALEPGDELSWHVDPCESFSVVVRGERLAIEFRDSGEKIDVRVHPGSAGWSSPELRVHRAINTGSTAYEEVVTFLLPAPGFDPQPAA
jgi:quercetin dioxygenase-like cupin family protein